MTGEVVRDSQGPTTAVHDHGRGRAVDNPAFWWSAAVVFLVNAALTADEGRWLIALLQALTAMWALVAGVTSRERQTSATVDVD